MTLLLADTQVTDRSLERLVEYSSIFLLDVSRTGVTDRALESIAKMRGLVVLNLSGNPISDQGIEVLIAQAESSRLRSVSLRDTNVSQAEAERLRKALFQATVNSGPSDQKPGAE
jgi:tryptophan synthase alpha subunit